MAIQFVGAAVAGIPAGSATNTAISLTSLTGGVASAPSAGDVVFVAFAGPLTGGLSVVTSGYDPAAFNNTASSNLGLRVSYKVMGGTPDTIVTVGPTGLASRAGAVAVYVWRGLDAESPLDVSGQTAVINNYGRPTPPPILPVTSGADIVCFGTAQDAAAPIVTFSQSGAQLENFLSLETGQSGVSVVIGGGRAAWSSGTFTPVGWTGGSTRTNASNVSATLALRPQTNVTGDLAVTLDAVSLAASAEVPVSADLASTLGDVSLYASAQVGPGVSGEVGGSAGITLDDVTLNASATVEIIGEMAIALGGVTLSAFAISGSNGPFVRRPLIRIN